MSKSNAARYGCAAVLAAVGAFLVYEMVASDSSSAAKMMQECGLPADRYQMVQVYKGNGQLELSMYTFEQDGISLAVLDHTAGMGDMPGRALHKFYDQVLCKAPPGKEAKQCQGLVLDVGAYIGDQSLILAKLGFEVHAFEVQDQAAEMLRCSAMSNKLRNLEVVKEGLSDKMGIECLVIPMGALAHKTMVAPKQLTESIGCGGGANASMATLDHYWSEVLDRRQISFIKLTVEGHEDYVLKGGEELFMSKPPPYVLMEYSPSRVQLKNVDVLGMLKRISKYGYRVMDCRMQAEIRLTEEGVQDLNSLVTPDGSTELILVHESVALGADGTMKVIDCKAEVKEEAAAAGTKQ